MADLILRLDVSYAYLWSANETEMIVKKWRHRIKQVHFSNSFRGGDHLSFKHVNLAFKKSVEPLHDLNVSIVIEEGMKTSVLPFIKAEIKMLKNILGF